MLRITSIVLACLFFMTSAEARHVRAQPAAEGCNVLWPCEGVTASVRGERVVKAMGGFGVATKHYEGGVVEHSAGCPRSAFCGCGAAVRVFGHSVRELWLAANWFKFPRTAPAPGMVAVRRHHVMVLEADLGGGVWQVYDANSGRHLTRVHARSIAGYAVVNPRA